MSLEELKLKKPLKAFGPIIVPFITQRMGIQLIVYRISNVNISYPPLDTKALVIISESSLINFTKTQLTFDSETPN